jgi:hypothetical protein
MTFVVKWRLFDLAGAAPMRWFVVGGGGPEAAVQDADQAVAELA